jgi:hypothetical protein
MAEKEVKSEKIRYEIIEVPTETALMYSDKETGETLSQVELLKRIANNLEQLKKQLM